jgi:hypothetical protein
MRISAVLLFGWALFAIVPMAQADATGAARKSPSPAKSRTKFIDSPLLETMWGIGAFCGTLHPQADLVIGQSFHETLKGTNCDVRVECNHSGGGNGQTNFSIRNKGGDFLDVYMGDVGDEKSPDTVLLKGDNAPIAGKRYAARRKNQTFIRVQKIAGNQYSFDIGNNDKFSHDNGRGPNRTVSCKVSSDQIKTKLIARVPGASKLADAESEAPPEWGGGKDANMISTNPGGTHHAGPEANSNDNAPRTQ